MNKRIVAAMLAAGATTLSTLAALYGDTPNDTHAWSVHDMNRPRPKVIQAEPGKPPSDAIVLFDGTNLDAWCMSKDQSPCKWNLVDGAMEVAKGEIRTKQSFGDCQLHIEWASPAAGTGTGQGRGNSGIFLMGQHEVQVLDCYNNETYADGQTGSIYGETPPLVNACRKPGEFQTYDIIFHQPVWEGDVMKHPGTITVLHNGVLIQDHWEFEGTATHKVRKPLKKKYEEKLPLRIQDHGNPVRYRNIWIREIPSRYANTTHGGPGAKKEDVMALRKATAAELEKKVNWDNPNKVETLRQMLEVVSYEKTDARMEPLKKLGAAYLEELSKLKPEDLKAKKADIMNLRSDANILISNGVFSEDCKLRAGLQKIIDEHGLDKKK
jgi:Domain of Unknown Function (DUF1080)